MAFEMSCANCEGRLMVETLGIVVACPHCGTHLAIPSEIPGGNDVESASNDDREVDSDSDFESNSKSTWVATVHADDSPSSFPDFSGSGSAGDKSASESNVLVSEPELGTEAEVPSAVEVKDADPSAVMRAIVTDSQISEPISSFPVLGDAKPQPAPQTETAKKSEPEAPPPTAEESPASAAESSEVAETAFPVLGESSAADSSPAMPAIVTDAREDEEADAGFPALEDAPPPAAAPKAASAAKPAPAPAAETKPAKPAQEPAPEKKTSVYNSVFSRRGKVIPKPVFQAWVSYTILLTGGLAMAIYYIFSTPTSNLESLPDVKPKETKTGQVERILVPEKAAMPPGHTLALQETQRFGNIEVTPVKVTRGELRFVHYADKSRTREPDGPVLKLWVKFKNVSKNQTISPLDNDLLFFRSIRGDRKVGAWANNFVCRADDKSEKGDIVLVYDHLTTGDYDLKGQNLDTKLKPGQEVTIYIPSETGLLEKLKGALVWRVHFRKGYSPQNYGVTTVFEVAFPSDAIQPESSKA